MISFREPDNEDNKLDICGNPVVSIMTIGSTSIPLCKYCLKELEVRFAAYKDLHSLNDSDDFLKYKDRKYNIGLQSDGKYRLILPIINPVINGEEKIIDKESLINVYNSEYVKELRRTNTLFLTACDSNNNFTIDLSTVIGKVIGVSVDEITVELNSDNYKQYILPFKDSDLKASIIGTASAFNDTCKINRLCGFRLVL